MAWLPKKLQHPMTKANDDLFERVQKYTVEKHQGLWRFYHDTKRIPIKQTEKYIINDVNVKKGNVYIQKGSTKQVSGEGITAGNVPITVTKPDRLKQKTYTRKTMWEFEWHWWEQDHWAWDDKTGDVWRFKMSEDGDVLEKKLCGNVPAGTDPHSVLAKILDRDITVQDVYNSQAIHRKPQVERFEDKHIVKWCREFDGKNILALVIAKPKMTYAEIKNVIVNEGGSVDSAGIIHRD